MQIPWYYFGDISTVLYRNRISLETDCKNAISPESITEALKQPVDIIMRARDPHFAIGFTRYKVNNSDRKPAYPWQSWPGPAVKVRSGFPPSLDCEDATTKIPRRSHMFLLGPDHLVLPWKMDNIPESSANHSQFEVRKWDDDKPYDASKDVVADILFAAGDLLVTTKVGRTYVLANVKQTDDYSTATESAKRVLLDCANEALKFKDYALPTNTVVEVDWNRSTKETAVDLSKGCVRLILGFKGPNGTTDAEDVPSGSKSHGLMMYAEWPCGAFGS